MNVGSLISRLSLLCLLAPAAFPRQPLLVISVDGLDNRYLQNCDRLGLRIPHIRDLMQKGQLSAGVIGVAPTITWPSHTTIITGVTPPVHGILSNRLPDGNYPWSAHRIKVKTLLDAAHDAGLQSATITWPVTVDAPVAFDLPEYFKRRRGGAMDLATIESKSIPPDLAGKISAVFPSFPQEWMDDRTRTLAVTYLLQKQKPDLVLVHLVDLDSEEHDNAPFSHAANAILEYTDELIGRMLQAKPDNMAVALVSDHGFEEIRTEIDIRKIAADKGVEGVSTRGFIAIAGNDEAATLLQQLASDPENGIGRQIPRGEIERFAPELLNAKAVYESAEGVMFGGNGKDIRTKPKEIGNHGHWPTRYRAVFLLSQPGVPPARLPEIPMTGIAGQLARVLDLKFP